MESCAAAGMQLAALWVAPCVHTHVSTRPASRHGPPPPHRCPPRTLAASSAMAMRRGQLSCWARPGSRRAVVRRSLSEPRMQYSAGGRGAGAGWLAGDARPVRVLVSALRGGEVRSSPPLAQFGTPRACQRLARRLTRHQCCRISHQPQEQHEVGVPALLHEPRCARQRAPPRCVQHNACRAGRERGAAVVGTVGMALCPHGVPGGGPCQRRRRGRPRGLTAGGVALQGAAGHAQRAQRAQQYDSHVRLVPQPVPHLRGAPGQSEWAGGGACGAAPLTACAPAACQI